MYLIILKPHTSGVGSDHSTNCLTMANDNPNSIFRLSQHPGNEAAWYDHPQSRPVWSDHNYMIRCEPDLDLGLFLPKQHWPHCLAYSMTLLCPVLT